MDQEDSGCPQGALPLREAMWKWLPKEAIAAVRQAEEHMNRNARQVYWIGPDGKQVFGLDDSPHNLALIHGRLAAQNAAAAIFIRDLRAGRLVAWGREGSPLARFRPIPPDAWATLNFTDVGGGRAGGAGVELFSLRVAPPLPPAESAPAAPSPPEPVMSAESLPARASAGQAYSREALAAWFFLRVKTWPKGERTPSEPECIAAAESYFADAPGRDVIREIRQEKTPESWRKRGPRPRR